MSKTDRRLVAAPISWGICEVPGWGRMLDAERVLGEMASLGITATELGAPGFLPDDAAALRDTLDRHHLSSGGQLLARRRPRAVRCGRLRARDRAQARGARRRRDQPRARPGPGLERSTRALRRAVGDAGRHGRRGGGRGGAGGRHARHPPPRGDAGLHRASRSSGRCRRRRAAGAWTPGTCTSAGSIPPRSPPSTRSASSTSTSRTSTRPSPRGSGASSRCWKPCRRGCSSRWERETRVSPARSPSSTARATRAGGCSSRTPRSPGRSRPWEAGRWWPSSAASSSSRRQAVAG